MPSEFYHRMGRIKEVEREYRVVRLAVDRLMKSAQQDPAVLGPFQTRHFRAASAQLEGTYLIRLFAEFESSLRLFWAIFRSSQPKTRDLIDGVAALTGVSIAEKFDAHSVRLYRNNLIHEHDDQIVAVRLSEARHFLCQFFRRLASRWR
jgi:hypothetical protein